MQLCVAVDDPLLLLDYTTLLYYSPLHYYTAQVCVAVNELPDEAIAEPVTLLLMHNEVTKLVWSRVVLW